MREFLILVWKRDDVKISEDRIFDAKKYMMLYSVVTSDNIALSKLQRQ